MVVDTSILIAILFNEEHGPWALDQLQAQRGALCMSTLNLAEVLILCEDRQPRLFAELQEMVLSSSIRFVPPSVGQAALAAAARGRFPLNLGDCFAYALAKEESLPLLTLDRDFRKTDIPVVLPPR
ncbi:MAG: type II toxin-antitoxin system VapC family toxin [Acidobacteria bacterium]|nr:type II toxin-antitoxin system VapC family toxin [Acidobacteriota bacterium]